MFTWRFNFLSLQDLLDLFAWRLNFIRMENRSKRMTFSGQPETKNLRRPGQVCQERRKAAAGVALTLAAVLAQLVLLG